MNFYYWSTIFILFCNKSMAINQGYRNCLLGTGEQSPLLLQDGLRCAQVQIETTYSWDWAMDLCNSRQGHLLHIYSSEDAKLVNARFIQSPLTQNAAFIGEKKLGLLKGNFTGFNVRWFTTKTDDIGMEQSYQYYQYNVWKEVKTTHESKQIGATWTSDVFDENIRGYGTFVPLNNTVRVLKVLCEFTSDHSPKTQFKGQRGKRSLAPVYASVEEKHSMSCGNKCMRQPWCMGLNVVGNGNGVICEMIAVKQNDTNAGIIEDNDSTYFERNKG